MPYYDLDFHRENDHVAVHKMENHLCSNLSAYSLHSCCWVRTHWPMPTPVSRFCNSTLNNWPMLNRQLPNKAPAKDKQVKAFEPSQYQKPDASTLKRQLTRVQTLICRSLNHCTANLRMGCWPNDKVLGYRAIKTMKMRLA